MFQSKVQGRTGESVKEASYFQGRSRGGGVPGPNFCHYETYESCLEFTAIKALWFASQNAANRISDDSHFKISCRGGGKLPNKERFRRSVVNRASNTTLGTPLCKMAGYAPNFCLNTLEMSLWGYHLLSRNGRPN